MEYGGPLPPLPPLPFWPFAFYVHRPATLTQRQGPRSRDAAPGELGSRAVPDGPRERWRLRQRRPLLPHPRYRLWRRPLPRRLAGRPARPEPHRRSLIAACLDYIGSVDAAPHGAVACLTCGGPFTVPAELPWAVLVVCADIPEPSLVCCSGLCTPCCTWKDLGQLQREITRVYQTVFPGWGVLAISPEVGHA